jgi:hypothetical protein
MRNMTSTLCTPSEAVPHDEKYFQDLHSKLLQQLTRQLPAIDSERQRLLYSSIQSVVAAQRTVDACKLAHDKATSGEEKKSTEAALAAAEQALELANDVALQAAIPIFHELENTLLKNDELDSLLTKCSVLATATKQLADYCLQGNEQSKRVDELLANTPLLKGMLYNGGAKGNNYGQAFDIYNNTLSLSDENNEVMQRLALGTALELAVSVNEFDSTIPVDPIERFHHYKQAYVNGELDSEFQNRTTWEMRYISNSNAPNQQLEWCRTMLRNYRPDIMEWSDYKWKYVLIVRTDVHYNQPHWTSKPRTYQQMISGGGECGPRAWFGRFALQSFGIPTWGVRQPGHAALGHWTPDQGWVICLGAAWKYSTWEGREGTDFCLEAQSREQGPEEYIGVCRLEWVANSLGEKPIDGNLNPDFLWQSLALLRTRYLASCAPSIDAEVESSSRNDTSEIVRDAVHHPAVADVQDSRVVTQDDDGSIVIPAVACTKPTKSSSTAIFMKCFLGGMQIHVRDEQSLEYILPLKKSECGRYQLTIHLVTVHLKTRPLLLTVSSTSDENDCDEDLVTVCSIQVPYTVGEWAVTAPVEIELTSGTNALSFERETPNNGLTIKELILKPVT